MGFREGLTYTHYLLAQVYLAQRDLDQATRAGRLALDIANEIDARLYQANAHKVLGQTFLALDQRDRARIHIEATRRLFSALGNEAETVAAEAALHVLDQRDGEDEDKG
jgi:hypothetical protein